MSFIRQATFCDPSPLKIPCNNTKLNLTMFAKLRFPGQGKTEVSAVVVVHGRREVLVARLRKLRLLVEQAEDAVALRLDEIDAVLVVDERNLLHPESLFLVKVLLVFENPLIEKLLQLLVAVVDAKLLAGKFKISFATKFFGVKMVRI